MEALLNVVDRLQASLLSSDLIMFDVFKNNESIKEEILDMIRYDQLYNKGIRGDGSFIGHYSDMSKLLKQDPMKDHITLKETGSFYSSFNIFIGRNYIMIDGNGNKIDDVTGETVNLFAIYDDNSGDLLNLTDDNRDRLVELLKPLIIQDIWRLMK